jgi:hypothetical protein
MWKESRIDHVMHAGVDVAAVSCNPIDTISSASDHSAMLARFRVVGAEGARVNRMVPKLQLDMKLNRVQLEGYWVWKGSLENCVAGMDLSNVGCSNEAGCDRVEGWSPTLLVLKVASGGILEVRKESGSGESQSLCRIWLRC